MIPSKITYSGRTKEILFVIQSLNHKYSIPFEYTNSEKESLRFINKGSGYEGYEGIDSIKLGLESLIQVIHDKQAPDIQTKT